VPAAFLIAHTSLQIVEFMNHTIYAYNFTDVALPGHALQDNYLELTIAGLESALTQAEAARKKRLIRKLKRRIGLCSAYLLLIRQCIPLIRAYHAKPLYIVNQFWHSFLSFDNLLTGNMPVKADFFSWYCGDDTVFDE
jgi:hypothetical protein